MLIRPENTIIVSDLDGTLLPSDKKPLERDLAAIRAFEQAGGRFVIATGRTIQAAERYQTMLGLETPMIVYNGAAIYDKQQDKVLFSESLPSEAPAMTQAIMEAWPETGVEVLRAENAYVVRNNEQERLHIELCGVSPCYCSLEDVPEGSWLKVLFAAPSEEIPALAADIAAMGYENVDFIRSAGIFYEMLPKNVTKGSALTAYRKLPGMEDVTFVAVGDYDNDLAMLQAADFSAAPANALPEVKAAADLVLERTCEEGAMEELISRILSGTLMTKI